MGSKKKDLEIIYSLEWKNKPANGGDKANIIGMYDIPATTLNWEIFKSYLLKNSGTVGDDVKVSYITDSNREFPIESQTDFQVALYAFRRKARMGDIVNLKLDRISDQPTHKNSRHSNDVETQIDNNEAVSLVSTCCNIDAPPDWFITYMEEFKKSIADQLAVNLSNIKPQVVNQPLNFEVRKPKPECPKRIRKQPALLGEALHDTKDLRKSSKLEGILERKLEKLEHKTKKIKERKLALLTKSSDSDAGPSTSRRDTYHCIENEEDLLLMDAAPVNRTGTFPRMLGGEVYLHKWEVMNTGKLPWTSKTSLMFTWGSKALKPLDTIISVPYLRPGDTGTLAVRLQIPNHPGLYECYWHFHHKERRFGHWLGCQIIVDPFDLKGTNSVLETSFAEYICNAKKFKTNDTDVEDDVEEAVTQYSEILQEPGTSNSQTYTFNIEQKYTNEDEKSEEIKDEESSAKNVLDTLVRDISTRVEDMKLHEPTDTNCSSDSDNQSIVSLTESCSSKSLPEEFVVVPIPDCFKVDVVPDLPIEDIQQEQNIKENEDIVTDILTGKSKQATEGNFKLNAEEVPDNFDDNNNTEETDQNVSVSRSSSKVGDNHSNDGSQKSDIVIISLSNEKDDENTGYAYVIIDGHRLQIPKKILKSEYLITAEGTPSPKDNMTRSSSVASSVEIVDKEEVPQLEAVNSDAQTVTQIPPGEQQTKDSTESNSNIQSDGLLSHCSAEGSTFSDVNSAVEKNSRLFIFPQSRPGYEVFYPVADAPENSAQGELQWMYCDMENVNSENTVLSHPEFHNYPVAPLQPTIANSPPLNLSTHDRNPFITGNTVHVPNYQQTPPSMRTPPESTVMFTNLADRASTPTSSLGLESHLSEPVRISESSSPIHILPETLVAGAVNVASSAINTARSVINMIVPREQPGRWVNGHWVSTNPATPREGNLQALAEMGFWNRDLNATLLARYNDDLSRVVAELVQ